MTQLETSLPTDMFRRNTATTSDRLGTRVDLQAPGVVPMDPTIGQRNQQIAELLNAADNAAVAVARFDQFRDQQLAGQGVEQARLAMPELVSQAPQIAVQVPDGMQVADYVVDYIEREITDGMPEAVKNAYLGVAGPALANAINQYNAERRQGELDAATRRSSQLLSVTQAAKEVDAIIAKYRDAFPAVGDDEVVTALVLPALRLAADSGDRETFDAIAPQAEGTDPGTVKRYREVMQSRQNAAKAEQQRQENAEMSETVARLLRIEAFGLALQAAKYSNHQATDEARLRAENEVRVAQERYTRQREVAAVNDANAIALDPDQGPMAAIDFVKQDPRIDATTKRSLIQGLASDAVAKRARAAVDGVQSALVDEIVVMLTKDGQFPTELPEQIQMLVDGQVQYVNRDQAIQSALDSVFGQIDDQQAASDNVDPMMAEAAKIEILASKGLRYEPWRRQMESFYNAATVDAVDNSDYLLGLQQQLNRWRQMDAQTGQAALRHAGSAAAYDFYDLLDKAVVVNENFPNAVTSVIRFINQPEDMQRATPSQIRDVAEDIDLGLFEGFRSYSNIGFIENAIADSARVYMAANRGLGRDQAIRMAAEKFQQTHTFIEWDEGTPLLSRKWAVPMHKTLSADQLQDTAHFLRDQYIERYGAEQVDAGFMDYVKAAGFKSSANQSALNRFRDKLVLSSVDNEGRLWQLIDGETGLAPENSRVWTQGEIAHVFIAMKAGARNAASVLGDQVATKAGQFHWSHKSLRLEPTEPALRVTEP